VLRGSWPNGHIKEPSAAAAQEVARRFIEALDNRSLREAAGLVGVAHTTLSDIANGRTWPDFVTLVRIGNALDYDPWPGAE
jgi:hypothetical protein